MAWGAVKASEVVEGDTEQRFKSFLEALLEGRIVPLLGSGVSRDSVPTRKELLDRLRSRIEAPFSADGACFGDFSRLAEVLQWQHGNAALPVCKALEIAEWADAPPTRAHRYLALLACEKAISVVITTNYDCGLDTAWRQARGSDPDGWEPVAHGGDLDAARPRWEEPRLYLYKINGCSARLINAPDNERETRAQEIQITDLQLQKFGERRWAQRIFEALFQERQLALSGFGSDEPQIWCLIMDILNEFSTLQRKDRRYLWVAEYEECIDFHILRALVGENQVRGRSWKPFDNVFSKHDCNFFDSDAENKLDAGSFWRRVWIEALRERLVDRKGPVIRKFEQAVIGNFIEDNCVPGEVTTERWQEIIHRVFNDANRWLEEPKRESGASLWARDGELRPERNAPCAPGLACIYKESNQTTYLPLQQNPSYWVLLMLVLLANLETNGPIRARQEGIKIGLDIPLDSSRRRMDFPFVGIDRENPSNTPNVGPDSPAETPVPAPAGTSWDHSTSNTNILRTLVIPTDLLRELEKNWRPEDGLDTLADVVRWRLKYPLQASREAENKPRDNRRKQERAP